MPGPCLLPDTMRIVSVVGLVLGLGLTGWLIADLGPAQIVRVLSRASWAGLMGIVLFHLLQLLPSAAGWRVLGGAGPGRGHETILRHNPGQNPGSNPGLGSYLVLRWVREGINNLLPVAQIGGEIVAARRLAQRGLALAESIAATVCDLTIETVTQIVFAAIGLALLPRGLLGGVAAFTGIAIACLLVGGFVAAQVAGATGLIERFLLRLGGAVEHNSFRHVSGMESALRRRYRMPGRLLRAASWHLFSWLLGGVEVCLILHVLGHGVGLRTGLLLESLGQAVKSMGFAVPGAVGVQEGGYAAIAALLGLPPDLGLALSLVKRLREVVYGLPALGMWRLWEQGRGVAAGVRP